MFLQLNRSKDDVMFFDCSEVEEFNKEQIKNLQTLWMERKTIPGLCSCVSKTTIQENDYNLNLPRYITKIMQDTAIDVEQGKARIQEINKELDEIEKRIQIYRHELGL